MFKLVKNLYISPVTYKGGGGGEVGDGMEAGVDVELTW